MAEISKDMFQGELERAQEWSDFSVQDVLEAVAIALGPEQRRRVEEQLEYWRKHHSQETTPQAE